MKTRERLTESAAFRFIVLISVVSLFADMVYEGARSASGPYLSQFGADALIVGTVAGFGELIGYGLRFIAGNAADKTRAYWVITIAGYAINLLAVPALAFAGNWQMAALFLVLERAGKAIRTPSRDVMLSAAGEDLGTGFTFGLHQAMDQIGAVVGPLIVALVAFYQHGYRDAFLVLGIPAVLALVVLMIARALFPNPHDLSPAAPHIETKGLTRNFWLYLAGACCVAAGYADFPLLAFHFKTGLNMQESWIPLFYSLAMLTDAIAGFALGKLFDRFGVAVLSVTTLATAIVAPLTFMTVGLLLPAIGVALWGVGSGAQGSIMRAVIANLVSREKRGAAYGLFGLLYGVSWFAGSALLGFLYGHSMIALVMFSSLVQLAAIPLFFASSKQRN